MIKLLRLPPIVALCVVMVCGSQAFAVDYSATINAINGNRFAITTSTANVGIQVPVTVACSYPAGGDKPSHPIHIEGEIINGSTSVSASLTLANPVWGLCVYDIPAPGGDLDQCQLTQTLVFSLPPSALTTGTYQLSIAVTNPTDPPVLLAEKASSFGFTLFSGRLTAGPNRVTFTSITLPAAFYQTCAQASPNVLGLKGTALGKTFTDNAANLCVTAGVLSHDGTMTLSLTSGDIALGNVTGANSSNLTYTLADTVLDSTGLTYSTVTVELPDGVTVHAPDTAAGHPSPRGLSQMVFPSAGHVSTPSDITLTLASPYYLYSYGLPFWVVFSNLTLDFNDPEGIILPSTVAVAMDLVHMLKCDADDSRRMTGFPSNSIPYFISTASKITITADGLQGDLPFKSKTSSYAPWTSADYKPQSAFPKGNMAWDAFTVTLGDGQIQPTTLTNVSFDMDFSGNCPEGICGDSPDGTHYAMKGLTLGTGNDGALGGQIPDVIEATHWGKYNGSRYTYEKTDTARRGMLFFPGNRIPGSSAKPGLEGRYTISQYLFGARQFSDVATLERHYYLNDPDNDEARWGNHFFAGLTLGPQTLEPSVDKGLNDLIDDTDLSILFNGESVPVAFDVTPYTKYVIRPGGITGVFNTGFSGLLSIYGYKLQLSRFAFRQDVNRLDDQSFIDGFLDLPFPAELRVGFTSLELTCTGDMAGGQVDKENSGDRLAYWNTPTDLLGMGFEDTTGALVCPDPANRQLRLDSSNQVNGISRRVTLNAFWSPAGEPSQDKMTSAVGQHMDTPETGDDKGFSVVLRDGYLNHENYTATTVTGFTNLNLLVDLPLFNDLPVLGHFQNDSDTDFSLYMSKDLAVADADMNGIPDTGYPGWTLSHYREELTKNDETLAVDPRPEATYSWAGLIHLDYPLLYTRAASDKGPQFTGVKQTSHLPGGSDPVITITSTPDYLKPDTAKVSFGATADVAELQNFHVDLSSLTGNLDDFLASRLNVALPIEGMLGDLVNSNTLMHAVTGGDITGLLEPVLDTALDTPAVSNGFNTLSSALRKIHQAPSVITSQIENRINGAKDQITSTISSGLTEQFDTLYNSDLAAFIAFDPATLQGTGYYTSDEIQTYHTRILTLTSYLNNLKGTVSGLKGQLSDTRDLIQSIRNEVDSTVGTVAGTITTVNGAIGSLTEYTSPDMATNPLLTQVNSAKNSINSAISAIKALDLGTIGDALKQGASLAGGTIDTSMIDEADAFLDSRVSELEQLMTDAENELESSISSTGLNTIFTQAQSRISFIQTHINTLYTELNGVFDLLLVSTTGGPVDNGYLGVLENSLASIDEFLGGFGQAISQDLVITPIDTTSTSRAMVVQMGRDKLDQLSVSLIMALADLDGDIGDVAGLILSGIDPSNPANAFADVFESGLASLVNAPLDQVIGGLSGQLDAVVTQATSFIPDATADDLKEMVKGAIMNSGPIQNLNTVFFAQFGFISDYVDDLSGEVTSKINGLINETMAAVSEGLSAQLASVSSDVGGSGGGMSAAKMDGYAIISQDELERIHIDAEFDFGGKPDPTIYYAILDITNWNAENGKGSSCTGDTGGESMFDVVISTKDVKADMLGTDIGIKTASLGFTFVGLMPIGIFGNVYTSGDLDFEAVVLTDMGLEAGVGAIENYLGAKATGKFEDYTISAIFFFGKTCDFEVLKRLDKDVTDFIGDHSGFTGVYVRGGAEIPIFNYGCALKVGVGAEVGAWYLTDPTPTYGGLFGGSAYGRVACLAALKGKVLCSGSKVGDQYRFYGMGWGAGGVGFCEPSKWSSVAKSRSDSWCVTGDATFEATYSHGWTISGPDVHCCY